MHLALQPLFVEETALFLALFGKSWIASKIAAILHACLFTLALRLVLRRAPALADAEKAVLIACGFLTTLGFVGYRFDDYHILADCFQVYSILVLLKIGDATTDQQRFRLVAVAGILAALSMTTRLNDGAALFVGAAISVFFLVRGRRLFWSLIFCTATALTIVVVVSLTGDPLHAWATYSIFGAATTKGGAGNVLSHPMNLPRSAYEALRDWQTCQFVLYLIVCGLVYGYAIAPFLHRRKAARGWLAAVGSVIIVLPLHRYWHRGNFHDQKIAIDLGAVSVFLIYGLGAAVLPWAIWKLWSGRANRSSCAREILLLIPEGQLASGAMSSGGFHIGLYGPMAITLVLLPVVFPMAFARMPIRGLTIAIAAVLTIHFAVFKWNTPYLWHTYRAERPFVDRHWYRHPDYGPMIIDVHTLQMIEPICTAVHQSQSNELLSLPYPYPNYFCSIEPWHGYVQTFFDTSSSATIFQVDELQKAPPKWIVYQRQPEVLLLHEQVYNHGQPLAHRSLDQMIEKNLASGKWHAEYTSTFGSYPSQSNRWILIRTR
jgi:hypothetical protein